MARPRTGLVILNQVLQKYDIKSKRQLVNAFAETTGLTSNQVRELTKGTTTKSKLEKRLSELRGSDIKRGLEQRLKRLTKQDLEQLGKELNIQSPDAYKSVRIRQITESKRFKQIDLRELEAYGFFYDTIEKTWQDRDSGKVSTSEAKNIIKKATTNQEIDSGIIRGIR